MWTEQALETRMLLLPRLVFFLLERRDSEPVHSSSDPESSESGLLQCPSGLSPPESSSGWHREALPSATCLGGDLETLLPPCLGVRGRGKQLVQRGLCAGFSPGPDYCHLSPAHRRAVGVDSPQATWRQETRKGSWSRWVEGWVSAEDGRAMGYRSLGFTPSCGRILDDMMPPWPRLARLYYGQNFYLTFRLLVWWKVRIDCILILRVQNVLRILGQFLCIFSLFLEGLINV